MINGRDAEHLSVPMMYHKEGLDMEFAGISTCSLCPDLSVWGKINTAVENPEGEVNIAILANM